MNAKVDDSPRKDKTVECEPLRHMLTAGGKVNVRLNMPGHLYRSFPNGGFMNFLRSKTRNFAYKRSGETEIPVYWLGYVQFFPPEKYSMPADKNG